MTAAANWTAGQRQGLIPANWTVTDGNVTGIACNAAAGAIASFNECRDRLGHDRGICYSGADHTINGTAVCACFAHAGWDYSCAEARCTYGTASGCAIRTPNYSLIAVCLSLTIVLVTSTLLYALSTIWKGRAVCNRNVTSTTLAWLTLATLSLWLWNVSAFISTTVLASRELLVRRRIGVERSESGGGNNRRTHSLLLHAEWPMLHPLHPRDTSVR